MNTPPPLSPPLPSPAIKGPLGVGAKLLALDLGTKTGWASRSGKSITHGTQSFKSGRYEGGGMRFLRFQRWLDEICSMLQPEEIVFEEVRRHIGVDAAHVYGGLMATLQTWCEQNQTPYRGIPVGTIKKHITGKGNASKEQVMQAIRAKGFIIQDDNEADALALLDCVTEGAI